MDNNAINKIVDEYETKQETLIVFDIIDIYLGKYENYDDYAKKVEDFNLGQENKVFLKNAHAVWVKKKLVDENIFSTAYYKGAIDRNGE